MAAGRAGGTEPGEGRLLTGSYLVVQLLLGVESLQVEEILFKQVDVRLKKGLSKGLSKEGRPPSMSSTETRPPGTPETEEPPPHNGSFRHAGPRVTVSRLRPVGTPVGHPPNLGS